jgi:hypothetical protein
VTDIKHITQTGAPIDPDSIVRMPVSPAELFELVKDVLECWPEGLEFSPSAPYPAWSYHANIESKVHWIPEDIAADLILAGVVRKLWEKHGGVAFCDDHPWRVYTLLGGEIDMMLGEGPSELHAAVAAYRKVRR